MNDSALYKRNLDLIEKSWQSLPDKPEETPASTLRALWFFAAGNPRAVTLVDGNDLPDLNEKQEEALTHLVQQRMRGTPLAYITGRQEFMGFELLSAPGAMIPRKETEILGHAAVQAVKMAARERGQIKVLDLCTGSGNLALVLAKEEPACQVTGVDLSSEAVDLARRNAAFLDLNDRVDFICGDLFQPFENEDYYGRFDVITCNPPYISSAHVKQMPAEISGFEPELAFDGGPFGIKIPIRLIKEVPRFLKAGSWLCFEVGLGQGKGLLRSIQNNPAYQMVQPHLDNQGEIRTLTAQTKF
jgi:release factor glutamine methyltransferase